MGAVVVKKLLSFLLTAALVLSFLPLGLLDMTASAATSGTTGECTWSLDGTVLTISGNGVTRGYFDSVGPWGSDITEVIIENGVTGIGPYAFAYCSDLAKIVIPDSVVRIGYGAFNGTAYYNEPSNWEDGIYRQAFDLCKAKSERRRYCKKRHAGYCQQSLLYVL